MAYFNILVVTVILSNVVSGFSFRSSNENDDDDTFDYSPNQPLMMHHALPLPLPLPLFFPDIDQSFPSLTFPPKAKSRKHSALRHHHFNHNFPIHHHVFPGFVTADDVMDDKPNGDEEIEGVAMRTTSGDEDGKDGSTIITNVDGDVEEGTTGNPAHNMRHRIKRPKMRKTPGNHHTGFSRSSSTSTKTVNGKSESEQESSTTAVDDDKVEHEAVKMKKKDKGFMNNDNDQDDDSENNDDDWPKIRKPTPPKMLDLHFPDLDISAITVMDTQPGDNEEVAGYAMRSTSGDDNGNDGLTMVTNKDGDVKSAHTGKARHNMRQKIQPPKMKSGPGNHQTSFSTSSSSSTTTVNGKSISSEESKTMSVNDGKVEEEAVKMQKKDKDFKPADDCDK